MNGTFWYCGCWRIHCSNSSPDISGISQSHGTRSKLVLDIRDWARRPFWASVVSMTGKRWRTVRFTRSLTKLASSTTSAFSVAITTSAPDSTHAPRSEEHTSELQSRENLVCRLLLEKKKTIEYFCI